MRKRAIGGILVAAVAGLTVAPTVQAEDVKLGLLLPFTGPLDSLAAPLAGSGRLAMDHVNAQGGILGGKLALIEADSTCVDAQAASDAAESLVSRENVTAIAGPMCSGATMAIANAVTVPSGVALLSPTASSPALTELQDRDLVFRAVASDAALGEVFARMLLAKGHRDIAMTYVNNDYGAGFADALSREFAAKGGRVLASIAHEEGRADYDSELRELVRAGSGTLVILGYATNGGGAEILRLAVASNRFDNYFVGDGMVDDALFSSVDASAIDGLVGVVPAEPEAPGAAVYDRLAGNAGLGSELFAHHAYDAVFLLALAIEKNGTAGRGGLSEALREVATAPGEIVLPGEWQKAMALIAAGRDINYEGGSGALEFDAHGDVPGLYREMAARNGRFHDVGLLEQSGPTVAVETPVASVEVPDDPPPVVVAPREEAKQEAQPVAPQHLGRRVALIIGNAAYDHAPRLNNPVNDATALADTFKDLGFAEVTHVANLDYSGMRRALRDFHATARDADWALVYFSGHGLEVDGDNYLLPIDAEMQRASDVRFEAMPLDDVIAAAAPAGTLRLVIVDACRNNPFTDRMARAEPTRAVTRGLARVAPGGSTMVAFAASAHQLAFDGDGRHSPYAAALLEQLRVPKLEMGKLFRRVREAVLEATGGRQEPVRYGEFPAEDLFANLSGD